MGSTMTRTLTLASLLGSTLALGASVAERSLSDRAAAADRIVFAQVLSRETVVPANDPRRMATVTRVTVVEDLKGTGPSLIELVQPGGRFGLWESKATGDATFEPGETAVL